MITNCSIICCPEFCWVRSIISNVSFLADTRECVFIRYYESRWAWIIYCLHGKAVSILCNVSTIIQLGVPKVAVIKTAVIRFSSIQIHKLPVRVDN